MLFICCYESQIVHRRCQHQFDAVQLIDFAGARVIVDGYDIGPGECFSQWLDHAFSDDVVRQAAKRLGAHDVRHRSEERRVGKECRL